MARKVAPYEARAICPRQSKLARILQRARQQRPGDTSRRDDGDLTVFERNKVDNSRDITAAAAQIELDDGRKISGRFLIPRSKALVEVLNGPAQFIEFETYDGDPELIAKSSIRSLRMISAPSGRHPKSFIKDVDNFNPYEILGLEKGASRAAVRTAFLTASKTYHPDRYSSAELPDEVLGYLEAMARRINAAYEVLLDETARAEDFASRRTQPIYQSSRSSI
jgi:hypothetical protein